MFEMGHDLVVTGATGYLGGRFLEALLPEVEGRVYAIGRPSPGRSLAERLSALAARAPRPGALVPVEWDLVTPLEAADPAAREALLGARAAEVWHFAAVVSFDPRDSRATEDVNVGGTRRMLELAACLRDPVTSFNFVGTAFDTGVHEAPADIPEEGDRPSAWHNPYERSKFRAAELVLASGLPCRVFKPSIVTDELDGDDALSDETIYGFAKVLYGGLRADRSAREGTPHVRFHADPATELNLVPVDVVVNAMLGIRRRTPADGRAYHVVNPRGTSLEVSMAALADVAGFTWSFVERRPETFASEAERVYYERLDRLYAPYLLRDGARFRTDNLAAALGPGFVSSVPELDGAALRGLFRRYFRRRLGVEVRDGRVCY